MDAKQYQKAEKEAKANIKMYAALTGCTLDSEAACGGVELLPPTGYRFNDGGDGLTGLLCDDHQDCWNRIQYNEAELAAEWKFGVV